MKNTIIYVMSDANRSGGPMHVLALVKGLKGEFNIKVISPSGWLIAKLREQNIEIFETKINIFSFLKIRKYYKKYQGDNLIIHTQGGKAGGVGRLAALGLQKKLVYTEHNWTKDYKLDQRWREPFQILALRILSRFTDKIICVSYAVRDFYKNKKISKPKKLTVIYNGVRSYNAKKSSKFDKDIVIGTIGSLVRRKGYDVIIKALCRLKGTVGFKIKLLVIGEGQDKQKLQNLATKLRMSSNIEWLGHMDDMSSFWNRINIYVQASFDESFGMAIAEALVSGVPVVASDVGAVSELVDRENLFRKGDDNSMAMKLKKVVENYEEYFQAAHTKKGQLENKFSIERMVAEYRKFYERL
jgi:glycosyltransferase involved in cell wall biosynthesis